jgi:hypothetical protein
MEAKAVRVDTQLWGGRPGSARQALQAQYFLPSAWAERNPIGARGRLQRCERAIGVGFGEVGPLWFFDERWVHHVEHLSLSWRRDVDRFYGDQIDWETLENNDQQRSSGGIVPLYVVGYLSFGCFILGAGVGLLFARF